MFSPFDTSTVIGRVEPTPLNTVNPVFERASSAQPDWDTAGARARGDLLLNVAEALEHQRTEFMALLVNEAGKCIADANNEIREAADFCRYYASQLEDLFAETALPSPTGETNRLSAGGRGVWVCISPWNFPLAIFLGQVSAALATGNTVIAKPAPETPLIAQRCVELLHKVGVPHDVCQLVIGGAELGHALVTHPRTAGVAFTGSTAAAHAINRAMAAVDRAIAPLIAETGGQNAMLVDSTALIEQVTDDVIESAFKSAGQRCSALRVLYLQNQIADQALEMIIGAMGELKVGNPDRLSTDIGPVISARASLALADHLEVMRAHDRILYQAPLADHCKRGHFVAPTLVELSNIGQLKEEHFGPILHVVRFAAADIPSIMAQVNATGYALTFGLHTRIDARVNEITTLAQAGNVYVNRNIIGAVVGSQPFGGQHLSGTGPKAGGPNYLRRFISERVVTVNTVATGGNTDLLRL